MKLRIVVEIDLSEKPPIEAYWLDEHDQRRPMSIPNIVFVRDDEIREAKGVVHLAINDVFPDMMPREAIAFLAEAKAYVSRERGRRLGTPSGREASYRTSPVPGEKPKPKPKPKPPKPRDRWDMLS